jgi:hypothetical protein
MKSVLFFLLLSFAFLISSPVVAQNKEKAIQADKEWKPTGEWPFLHRRFEPATIVTGFINKKKTVYPCNIHIGKQTLMYVLNDTLMQASPGNVNYVEFRNGEKYIAFGNTFAQVIREDSVGRVLRVRLIDMEKFKSSEKDASNMSSFTLGGDFGELNIDFSGSYIVNPEEEPLPVIDTYFLNYNKEIFEVTDKNILQRIRQDRRKEYRGFTRSAEIISRNESSVLKIWDTFFVNY